MKRSTIASIAGIALYLSVAPFASGQGSIWFDNYNNLNPNGPNSGYSTPLYVGSLEGPPWVLAPVGFVASLYYALGTVTDPNAAFNLAPPIGTLLLTRPISFPGYVSAAIATVPDYVSGPVTFEIVVSGTIGGMSLYSHTQVLTVPSLATGTRLPGYLDGLQMFVPEPSAVTLVSLGAGIALIRRRQKIV